MPFIRKKEKEAAELAKNTPLPVKKPELFLGSPITDVIYIHSTKEEQLAYLKDGISRPWKYGIAKGFEMLPAGEYMIANRSEIFRFDNVLRTEYVNVEKTMMRAYLKIPANKVVEISRENTSANKAFLKSCL